MAAVAEAAARGGDEGRANGAGDSVGQALAFFWSSDARRGGIGSACVPRGDQFLRRSATASSDDFLKLFDSVLNADD